MKTFILDYSGEWDLQDRENSAVLEKLVQRFTRAGWITGPNLVSPGPVHVVLNERGAKRFGQFGRLAKRIAPALCNGNVQPPKRFGVNGWMRLAALEIALVFTPAFYDLVPPLMSNREREFLRGLAVVFARGEFVACDM